MFLMYEKWRLLRIYVRVCHNIPVKYFTKDLLTSLFPTAMARTYPAGQIVIYQGDRPSHMFFINKGGFKYYDIDQSGNEKIISVLGPTSFVPLFYTFGTQKEIQAFYSTLEETELLLIPLDEFRERLYTDRTFSHHVMRWFIGEAEFLAFRIRSLERNDAKGKIAETLHYLALRHGIPVKGPWYRIAFPVSQQTLADLTGLTRETVSITLKDIDKHGIIRYPKQSHLEINKQKLEKIVYNPQA